MAVPRGLLVAAVVAYGARQRVDDVDEGKNRCRFVREHLAAHGLDLTLSEIFQETDDEFVARGEPPTHPPQGGGQAPSRGR